MTVDKRAILEYLTFHYCRGDKTFAHEIRRVPQGIRLVYCTESKTLRFETKWDYTSLPSPDESNVEKQVRALVEALEHSVRRRCQHSLNVVCLLSGGWDSRAVAGILSNSNIPFETLTTEGDTGLMDDPDCARLVAEEIGVPNSYIPIPPDYLEKYWKAKCQLTDFATTMHTWLIPIAQSHRFEGFVNLDGIAGDVAVKGLMLNEEQLDLHRAGKRNDLINVLLARHSMGNANRCLNLNEYSKHMGGRFAGILAK